MVDTLVKVFNGALDATYRGAKKLLLATVVVAIVASAITVIIMSALAHFM